MRHVVGQIRQLLSILEAALPSSMDDDFQAGDVVQLHPHTCSTWGGALFRVTRVRGCRVEGYFLRPHRGGFREAWSSYTRGQLVKVGRISYDDDWPQLTTAELAGEATVRDLRALERTISRPGEPTPMAPGRETSGRGERPARVLARARD